MTTLLAALLVLAGCLPKAAPWSGNGKRLGVVGDSQIYQLEHDTFGDANHHMTDEFVSAGYQVSTSTLVGATTADLTHLATSTAAAGWPEPGAQVVVIALGANDMRANGGTTAVPLDKAESNLNSYLDALGNTCDVFVETPQTTPWSLDQTAPPWNAFLATQAFIRNGVVVPWASMLMGHLTGTDRWVGEDQVHQTLAGKTAYLAAIKTASGQCVR